MNLSRGTMRRAKRKQIQQQQAQIDAMDSLPWISSDDIDEGFPMLEEIDEAAYGLAIPEPLLDFKDNKDKTMKSKKRKHDQVASAAEKETSTSDNDDDAQDKGEKIEHVDVQEGQDKGEGLSSTKKMDTKKKKKSKAKKQKHDQVASAADKETSSSDAKDRGDKVEHVGVQEEQDKGEGLSSTKITDSKKKKKTKAKETPEIDESTADGEDGIEQECVDEDDYYAWNELRLHPLIMRSIYRLGFKEPTAIQKSCIPAAAHQGKDVFGAAETGSGKTLAFGLPILQRLLEEREKAGNIFEENEEKAEKVAPKGLLRALIITPTRELACQVSDHLKAVAKGTGISVIPIVGGMSAQKQERLLKLRPEIVVGTPGRLWELMDGGEKHLVELHSLSFFVLDEADRMIENGHFDQLQLIIDKLPVRNIHSENEQDGVTMPSFQRKKRQTFVLSATIALSTDFRKKLKRSSQKTKQSWSDSINSIEALSERAGMRDNVAIIDLTNTSIMANNLEESFIECREEDKDAYLYYILSVHGQGRTIIFCTSVAALRHITSLLRILGTNVLTLHAQMHQRSRLKAMDRFRGTEHGKLVATDVAARGLDIPGVRTVIHYQLPHSAEVYVHRSGRTARATADGCSIALIAPNETSKFASLCKSFSKASVQGFPLDRSYLPEVMRRLSLARQIDKIMRKDSKDEAQKSWYEKNAESIELMVDDDEDEDDKVKNHKRKKASSMNLIKLQQELQMLLSRPLQPKSFSHRYLTGAGITPLVQNQLEELAKQKLDDSSNSRKKSKLIVIGQNCVEPLQALRSSGQEVHIDVKGAAEKRRVMENLRRKKKDQKKRLRDQRRKKKKQMKGGE